MFEVSNKILCVDDQPEVTQLLEQQLKGHYQVYFANSGADALVLLSTQGPFAVMLVDYAMPGMDGVTLLREVHGRSPDTVSIMLTAFADVSVAVSALHEAHIFRFVRKPWDINLLTRYIDDALEHYRVVVTERNLSAALERVNQRLYEKVQELESAHRLLTRWVQFSPAVIYSAVQDGEAYKLTYVSPNISDLTGYTAQELMVNAQIWGENLHEDDAQTVRERLRSAPVDDARVNHTEYRFRHKHGEFRWIKDAFRKVIGANGFPEVIGSWTDITDLKSLQSNLTR
ncbi:MAG: response regulator [Chromatiales bacterium]